MGAIGAFDLRQTGVPGVRVFRTLEDQPLAQGDTSFRKYVKRYDYASQLRRVPALRSEIYKSRITDYKLPMSDELFMQEAIREAVRAQAAGEVPVGAIVVYENAIVGRGCNQNLLGSDPTAHAEIVALRQAALAVGNHRLLGCELFVTLEPCAMCAGAMVHARLGRLVYGADDPKAGAVRSVLKVLNHPQLNHQMEVTSGVLAARCAELLQEFFRARRVQGT